jgi:hypothetical protein
MQEGFVLSDPGRRSASYDRLIPFGGASVPHDIRLLNLRSGQVRR